MKMFYIRLIWALAIHCRLYKSVNSSRNQTGKYDYLYIGVCVSGRKIMQKREKLCHNAEF